MTNYNMALIYKECYKNQLAAHYIDKCRKILETL